MLSRRNRRGRLIRGVTPALATMILLSGTIVLALIVGIFTYGFLGPSADKITLNSARLMSGVTSNNVTTSSTASLLLELDNPGRSSNITMISMSESGFISPITVWTVTPNSQVGNSFLTGGHNTLSGGKVSSFTLYPVKSPLVTINIGETYSYSIMLSDGESISGDLVAQ